MSTPLPAAPLSLARVADDATARVLAAGLAVGVLDGLLALGIYSGWLGAPPMRVFQAIVAMIVGRKAAFAGGAATTAAGVALHFCVALGWAAVYFAAYRRSARLRRATATAGGALLVGAAYGAFVWAFMQYATIPLARAVFPVDHGPPGRQRLDVALAALVGHMLLVGLPIVHLVRTRLRG